MVKYYKFLLTTLTLLVCIFALGCNSDTKNTVYKTTITDSIGRKVNVELPLKKVVVANGYNTELMSAVGALDSVIGVDYHIYLDQEAYKNKFNINQVIGKNQRELNYEKIIELAPQALILTSNGSWEEAERKLGPFGIKVITLDAYYTGDFFKNVKLLGSLFGKDKEAEALQRYFKDNLSYIEKQLKNVPKKTLYFEYRREGNTTIPGDYFFNMIEYAHAKNIFYDAKSVTVDSESVVLRNPEYIVKVGENNVGARYKPPTEEDFKIRYDSLCNRPGWDSIDAVKNNKILLLSHFAHGGASKLIGTMYIAKFLYPEHLPNLHPERIFSVWLEKYRGLDYIEGHTYPRFNLEE